RNQKNKSDQPKRLPIKKWIKIWPGIGDDSERRIGSPTTFGGTAGNKKTHQHDDAADDKRPITGSVYFRERHVGRADLERDDKISEGGEGERHYPKKNHDRPMHGAEGIVELRRHFAVRHRAGSKEMVERVPDYRHRLAWISQLPAHHHHQAKAEEQKEQAADAVLNTDDLVIGGENVLPPKA